MCSTCDVYAGRMPFFLECGTVCACSTNGTCLLVCLIRALVRQELFLD